MIRQRPVRIVSIFIILALVMSAGSPAERKASGLEERARALHKKILTVDTHCDTAFNLLRPDWKRQNSRPL
jgi:hypothetical protein